MINNNLFRDLIRYGKIKADFEVKDTMGRYFRVRVFEYQDKKYFTVMCDGEVLRCDMSREWVAELKKKYTEGEQ